MADPDPMDLTNICRGGVVAQVDDALAECVKNILDPNTEPTAKREVIIRLTLRPDKNRYRVDISAQVTPRLPGRAAQQSTAFTARRGLALFEHQPAEQQVLDVITRFPAPETGSGD